MASADPSLVRYATGRLAVNVTSFAGGGGTFPFDGTACGLVGGFELRLPNQRRLLTEEETNSVTGVVWLGGPVILYARVKGWDADAIANLIPGGTSAANGPSIAVPSTTEGQIETPLSTVVLSPYNEDDPGPTLVLWNVQGVPDIARDVPLSAYRGMHISIALIASKGANNKVAQLAHQSDITL